MAETPLTLGDALKLGVQSGGTLPGLVGALGAKKRVESDAQRAAEFGEETEAKPSPLNEAQGAGEPSDGSSGARLSKGLHTELGNISTGQPGSGFTAVGTQTANLNDEQKLLMAQSSGRIRQAEILTQYEQHRALGVAESASADWAETTESNYELSQQLHNEHFIPARAKIQKLQQQVDDARSMKVNPFNWHETVGKSGRVAAAFSVLTAQMAAGAGNPNSALKMMDAAIARDIAAQQANIKNNYDLLKLQRNLTQDERDLYTEQMQSMKAIEAQKYAALVGRVEAAQASSATEAHRMSLDVIKDHMNVKMLEAISATNAEILRLEFEGPVKNAAHLSRLRKQQESMQAELDKMNPPGQLEVPIDPVTTREGTTVADLEAQGMGGRQVLVGAPKGRAAAVAGRGGRVTTPGVGRGPGRPEAPAEAREQAAEFDPTPRPLEDEATGTSRVETEREVAARRQTFEEEKKLQKGAGELRELRDLGRKAVTGGVSRQDVARVLKASGDVDPVAIAHDGFALGVAKKITKDPTTRTLGWTQALNDWGNRKTLSHGGFTMNQDAVVFADMIVEPQRKNYQFDENGRSLNYEAAMDFYEYAQEYPEVFEKEATVGGEPNTLRAGGRKFRFLVGSDLRTDKATRKEVADKLQEGAQKVDLLKSMAERIRRSGINGMYNAEDGTWQWPGFNSSDPDSLRNLTDSILGAMAFIKENDPTARISDKDLEVGAKAMGDWATKGGTILDLMQSLVGDDTKRRQIENFLGVLAVEAQENYWKKHQNYLVPDYNTHVKSQKDADATQRWLNSRKYTGR
jgi:hypothetical protein